MSEALENYENQEYEGNSAKYHTGKPCIENGCTNPAGTVWSPYWCFQCNVKRMRRIDAAFKKIAKGFAI